MAMETHENCLLFLFVVSGCFCFFDFHIFRVWDFPFFFDLSWGLSALKIPLNPSKALKGPILPKMPLEAEWTEGLLNESGTD